MTELCQMGYLSEPGNKTISSEVRRDRPGTLVNTHALLHQQNEPSWGLLKPECSEIDHMTAEMRRCLVFPKPELGRPQESGTCLSQAVVSGGWGWGGGTAQIPWVTEWPVGSRTESYAGHKLPCADLFPEPQAGPSGRLPSQYLGG